MGQHFDSMQEAEKIRKAKMRQFKEKGATLVSQTDTGLTTSKGERLMKAIKDREGVKQTEFEKFQERLELKQLDKMIF